VLFNEDIREATDYLVNVYIPGACVELERHLIDCKPYKTSGFQIICDLDPNQPFTIRYFFFIALYLICLIRFERAYDQSKVVPNQRMLTEFLHRKGINFRYVLFRNLSYYYFYLFNAVII
jgi:hypothetical protein